LQFLGAHSSIRGQAPCLKFRFTQGSAAASAGFGFAQPAEATPFPPSPKFRGGHLLLKTLFSGVRRRVAAFQSGALAPHSKRKSTKKDCFGDKMVNFADSFLLLVLLTDGGQAVLCTLGLFGGGNKVFSNPCPPLNLPKGREGGR